MTSTALPQLELTAEAPERVNRKHWVVAGIGAAVTSVASIAASLMSGAAYEPELAGDSVGIVERLAELTGPLLMFHTATVASALLLVVFASGLRRFLEIRTPLGHLAPQVAAFGLMLVSIMQLMAAALNTEFIFGVQDVSLIVPETAVFFGHWIGTVPWFWAGAGVSALAVGVAGRRYSAVPTWLAWLSLVLGGLTTILALSPLQYLCFMPAVLWLLVTSLAMLRSR